MITSKTLPPATSSAQRIFERLQDHQTFCATLILLLVLHVCFFPFIWGDQTFLASARDAASILPSGALGGKSTPPPFGKLLDPGAAAWQSEPWGALIHYQYLTEKVLPFWNPYQAYGAPLAANMQSQPFNPVWMVYSTYPTPRTYNYFILFRLLLAGIFTYLYLRFFLAFCPSLAGAITCMLAGYYILYISMSHLSVDVLVSAIFYATERLIRRPGTTSTLMYAFITFLVLIGGMPETALLTLSFSYLYFFPRILFDNSLKGQAGRPIKQFVIGVVSGFGMAAILLAPFVEYMGHCFDGHQSQNLGGTLVGLAYDPLGNGLSLGTYIAPLLLGPPWNNITNGFSGHSGVRGFWGITPFLLALLSIVVLFRNRTLRGARHHLALIAFFSFSVVALILKRYGCPLVNWVGALPFLQLINYPKYDEALLGFSIAVLCALGLDAVLQRRLTRIGLILGILAAVLVLAGLFTVGSPIILKSSVQNKFFYFSLGGALAVLMALSLLIISSRSTVIWRSRSVLGACIITILIGELSLNYIYPSYYLLNHSADIESDPYRGAPYVDVLKSHVADAHWRVFGRDGVLSPEWASAFQISDIRGLDAMYYGKYLPFVRAFLPGVREQRIAEELETRFIGVSYYAFNSPLERKLLQLSSVRYVVSERPYGAGSTLATAIVEQNAGKLLPRGESQIRLTAFTINGDTKTVLFQHPPYERLPFPVEISSATQELSFSVAMDPSVSNSTACGDGVEFRLELRDSHGSIATLFDQYIDPKHNIEERRWIPVRVDLNKYRGQKVELLFSTFPGPRNDNCGDWCGWGGMRFDREPELPAFKSIYNGEAKVYEYDDVLPRAAVLYSAEIAADADAALARLTSPSLDVLRTAVLDGSELDDTDRNAIAIMDQLPPQQATSAKITSYTSQSVQISASLNRPGLLLLNDSNYPGWKAYVDGRPAKWISTNYLFRGVFLSPGKHHIEYKYQPTSIRAGVATSVGTLLLLLAWAFWSTRRAMAANKDDRL